MSDTVSLNTPFSAVVPFHLKPKNDDWGQAYCNHLTKYLCDTYGGNCDMIKTPLFSNFIEACVAATSNNAYLQAVGNNSANEYTPRMMQALYAMKSLDMPDDDKVYLDTIAAFVAIGTEIKLFYPELQCVLAHFWTNFPAYMKGYRHVKNSLIHKMNPSEVKQQQELVSGVKSGDIPYNDVLAKLKASLAGSRPRKDQVGLPAPPVPPAGSESLAMVPSESRFILVDPPKTAPEPTPAPVQTPAPQPTPSSGMPTFPAEATLSMSGGVGASTFTLHTSQVVIQKVGVAPKPRAPRAKVNKTPMPFIDKGLYTAEHVMEEKYPHHLKFVKQQAKAMEARGDPEPWEVSINDGKAIFLVAKNGNAYIYSLIK